MSLVSGSLNIVLAQTLLIGHDSVSNPTDFI